MADAGGSLMSKEIVRLLTDFSNTKVAQTPASAFSFAKTVRLQPQPEPEPVIEVRPKPNPLQEQAALVRAAVEKARAEERAAARQEWDQHLTQERARFQVELNRERSKWVAQQAEAIAIGISEAFAAIEERLSSQIANIIRPFVTDAFRSQALQETQAALKVLLSGTRDAVIRISGPEDLLRALKSRLGEEGAAIEFRPSDDAEVAVVASDTSIQTRLGVWKSRLETLLEDE
jgi:hypothetical protein